MSFFRKQGISLLVPTQNAERTVELCLRSFKDFPDELIVVDNGSTDNTIDIVRSLREEIPNMQFYEAPQLKDLYENRQYAFEQSQYRWIVRIDSDYIAYTSGRFNIKKLREKILDTKIRLRPVAYSITQVNLFKDKYHTGSKKIFARGNPFHGDIVVDSIFPPITTLPARIIQWYPGMCFERRGKWEGVRFQNRLNHIQIAEPYWFHCTFKDDMYLFFRSERHDWRQFGDFTTFPTLKHWVESIAYRKYGSDDIHEACEKFMNENIFPLVELYDLQEYFPYPDLLS